MGHICSNYYTYRLESNRRARNSWNYALIKRSFEILHPLSVGDVITNLTELPDGPYVVIRVGEDEKGRYARLKELPYIEYIIRHGEYRHISQVSLPFHDDIVQILYNEHRFFLS